MPKDLRNKKKPIAPISKKIINTIISPIQEFINDSRAVGVTLIICTIISLIVSNSSGSDSYIAFWNTAIHSPIEGIAIPHTILYFINDALMAVFFLLVGMEIKRELLIGELSDFKKASLPIFAAIGGMVVPALLYFSLNAGTDSAHGWGIPMATDIAFALGILSLLGKKVPLSLKVLLAALAIIDDLGAILAIAIFYTDNLDWMYLAISGGLFLLLIAMNLLKVNRLYPYFIVGIILWYCMFNSGVHATLAGVMLALTIPLKRISKLEHGLHDPVNFIILPLFALANTAIVFPNELAATLASPINHGILLGLIVGKPLGITLISFIMVKLGIAQLPKGITWKHIIGMGFIAGIGFTMSIFISMLAFKPEDAQITAKLAVLIASTIAALVGYVYLRMVNKRSPAIE